MADITITAANVVRITGSVVNMTAGEALTAGQLVYKDTAADNVIKLADADAEASAVILGVALHAALSGQPIAVQTTGTITIGGTVVVGEIYCATPTAGGVGPEADTLTGDYLSIFGVGTSATVITLNIFNSGALLP